VSDGQTDGIGVAYTRKKPVMKSMHIFIKVGEIKGRKIKLLKLYLLYIVFLSFSQKFSRSLPSLNIAFYPPLKNASMQCALRSYQPHLYFLFFGVIISNCRLPKFTENA